MRKIYVTKKLFNIISELRVESKYYETLAFIANVYEAAYEAKSNITKEQSWDLFAALQNYKCLVDEMANQIENHQPPAPLCIYKEEEIGELK